MTVSAGANNLLKKLQGKQEIGYLFGSEVVINCLLVLTDGSKINKY